MGEQRERDLNSQQLQWEQDIHIDQVLTSFMKKTPEEIVY